MSSFRKQTAAIALLAAGAAFAQPVVGDPLTSFSQWGSNPAVFIGGLVAIVGLLRARLLSSVNGKVGVFLLASAVGLIIGAIFQVIGMLSVAPFAAWRVPWGGLVYGEAAAIAGFLSVNLFDLFVARNAEASVTAQAAAAPLTVLTADVASAPGIAAAAQAKGSPIQSFLIAAAQSAVSALKLPAALAAIAPMLLEFAQSEVVLTDDLRANLQQRVLQALRAAGVSGVDV